MSLWIVEVRRPGKPKTFLSGGREVRRTCATIYSSSSAATSAARAYADKLWKTEMVARGYAIVPVRYRRD